MRHARDLDLGLTCPHRLNQNHGHAQGIQHGDDVTGGPCHPAGVASRGHTADEDPRIVDQIVHPEAIAQQCAPRVGAGRIYGDDRHPLAAAAELTGHLADQGAFSCAGRPGETDDVRLTRPGVERCQRYVALRVAILDQCEQSCRRLSITGERGGSQCRSIRVAARGSRQAGSPRTAFWM